MDFAVTSCTPNVNFFGKHRTYSKEALDKIFLPLLENKNMTKQEFLNANDIPLRLKAIWFKESFGKTISKFFNERRDEQLKNEIMECRKSGMSNREISKQFRDKGQWVNYKLRRLAGFMTTKELQNMLDEKMPGMLEAGYTIERCSKELKVSLGTLYKWVNAHKKESISDYRHNNNIKIKHDYDKTHADFKAELTEYFENGGTIKGATQKFKKTPCMIYAWMERFNIKSENQKNMIY